MSAAFFALQDTKTPVRIGYLTVMVHFIFCVVLMDPMQHGGIALALSISSVIQLFIMGYFITRKIGVRWLVPDVISSSWKSFLAATVMVVIVGLIRAKWLTMDHTVGMAVLTTQLVCLILIGVICYIGSAQVMGCRELKELRKLFISK
jgi:putative peptidoglycan lipid II flippase